MAHYICTGGCHGVDENEGVCKANACLRERMPLTECNCTDGQHKEIIGHSEEPAEQEESTNS
jgi:hypothetical protein